MADEKFDIEELTREDDPRPCDDCKKFWECHGIKEEGDEGQLKWPMAKACFVFEHWCDTGRTLAEVIEREPTEETYKRLYPNG